MPKDNINEEQENWPSAGNIPLLCDWGMLGKVTLGEVFLVKEKRACKEANGGGMK